MMPLFSFLAVVELVVAGDDVLLVSAVVGEGGEVITMLGGWDG